MECFNATIRLEGNPLNEVAKRGLTVPEIVILRRLHGDDAVVKLEHVGTVEDMDNFEERERLSYEYDAGLKNLHEDAKTSVEKMFGGDYNPLPQKLRDYRGDRTDIVTDDLEDFQRSLPFASPNVADRKTQLREKANARKKLAKEEAKKIVSDDDESPAPKAVKVKKEDTTKIKVPATKEAKQSALDAVL